MATQYGRLQEFQPETESIKAYLERADLYFMANEVNDAKKTPILLSSIGANTYALLSDLSAPATPKEKSFDEISKILKDHFEPIRSVIVERFHFHKWEQAVGETMAEYDAALRKLAVHCEFGMAIHYKIRYVIGLCAGYDMMLFSDDCCQKRN